jgi:glycosyltransferase involved in cell wall biosynthesis
LSAWFARWARLLDSEPLETTVLNRVFYISYDTGFLSIHCHEIIRCLLDLGVRVDVFFPANAEPAFELDRRCTAHCVPVLGATSIIATVSFHALLVCALAWKMLKGRPSFLYARHSYAGVLPPLLARLAGIPYIAEMNGSAVRRKMTARQALKGFLERVGLGLAAAIITPSHALRERLMAGLRIDANRIHVVCNGVNETLFTPFDKTVLRKNFGELQDAGFVVGFVGSMGAWQGIDTLKDAIVALQHDPFGADITFLIVGDYASNASYAGMKKGDGEGNKDITAFIDRHELKSKVVYRGFVPYTESVGYMNMCDFLVAPYTRAYGQQGGGAPMKLYAYLACRKPVIISDLGELTDAVALRQNNAAYLIEPDSGRALADAIVRLKSDPSLCRILADNGRAWVLANRKWSDSCAAIIAVYNSLK